jgi:hypothetical protein
MENTKKIIVHLEVGYAGMDTNEGWIVPVSMTEEELGEFCWERACDHAEMYGYYPPSDGSDDMEDEDEMDTDGDNVSNNIDGSWKDYDEEKHAGKLTYGKGGPQFQVL